MFNRLFSLVLVLGLTTFSNPVLALPSGFEKVEDVTVYSVVHNPHGFVVKTDDGTFFIGKSRDVVFRPNDGRTPRYGYWKINESNTEVEVYLNNGLEAYTFSIRLFY